MTVMDICAHIESLRQDWEGYVYPPEFCGEVDPHHHEDESSCQGIMCDDGCNAGEF